MKLYKIIIGGIIFTLMLCVELCADGVVAETTSGKLVKLEWYGYGTGFQQSLGGASLTIVGKRGGIIFEESYSKDVIVSYKAKKTSESSAIIELVIKSKESQVNLNFQGEIKETDTENISEIVTLVKVLQDVKRPATKNSYLKIKSPTGKMEFKDIVLGVYGDL